MIRSEVARAMRAAHIGRNGRPVDVIALYLDHKSFSELCRKAEPHELHDGKFQGVPVYIVTRMDRGLEHHVQAIGAES